MAAATTLDSLDERLQALEDAVSPEEDKSLIDSLTSINAALSNLATKRERVNTIFKKVPEVQEYLAPGFVEGEQLDVSAQRDYILMIEDEIKGITAQLEKVRELSSVLNSDHIRDFRKHDPQTNQIHVNLLEQLEETDSLSSDVAGLLSTYNDLIHQLSEYFVRIDSIVTNMEEKKSHEEEDG